MTNSTQKTLNIAFATSDQTHLDEHLGNCQSLAIYSVTPTSSEHLKTLHLPRYEGHHPQKIQDRLNSLQDCFAVYCLACGNPVRQQLLVQGVRVVIRRQSDLISAVIPSIQANWPGKIAARQVRQINKKKQMNYFEKLGESEWNE